MSNYFIMLAKVDIGARWHTLPWAGNLEKYASIVETPSLQGQIQPTLWISRGRRLLCITTIDDWGSHVVIVIRYASRNNEYVFLKPFALMKLNENTSSFH
jgi:hypothetical protein